MYRRESILVFKELRTADEEKHYFKMMAANFVRLKGVF